MILSLQQIIITLILQVDVLGDLIDAINQMTHPTPAGPSGPPVNAAVFSQIKSRLKIILSSKNFVD